MACTLLALILLNLRDQNISIQSFRRSTLSALEVRQCALQIDTLLTLRMKIIFMEHILLLKTLYTGSAAVYYKYFKTRIKYVTIS